MYRQEEIFNRCTGYKTGKQVTVLRKPPRGEVDGQLIPVKGIITERYPHHLVVQMGVRTESFTYTDIIVFKALKHRKGGRTK